MYKKNSLIAFTLYAWPRPYCSGIATYGRCQGEGDADIWLQEEDCRGWNQTKTATKSVRSCKEWPQLV